MPSFTFTSPAGQSYTVNGPDGSTKEQAWATLQQQLGSADADHPKPALSPTEGNSFGENMLIGIGKGITDLGLGIKQRYDEAANYLEQKLGTQGLNALLGLPNASDILKSTQDAIAEKRKVDAPVMQTGGGQTGNFLAQAAPAVAASMVPGGQGLAGSVLAGAAQGLVQPTEDGESVLGNVATGAAGGAAGFGVGKAVSRVINPNAATNAELQLLKEEGVTPTVGQTLGGVWNTAEQKLQSLPIMGDAIAHARTGAITSFDSAAINRATAPIGVEIKGSGQTAVKEAGDALSKAYDDALSQVKHVTFDDKFATDVVELRDMAQYLVSHMRGKFDRTLSNVVMDRITPQGMMLGETYKAVDSELGQIASKYMKSSAASESEFGDAVMQLKNLLNEQMQRSNPQIAGQIKAIDEGWANLVRVEAAAKSGKNASGVFTPAQLNAAIQMADDSVRKRAVARGTALMQDLGNAGQSVLGSTVPDSGTVGRLLLGTGAIATGLASPAIPAALVTGAAVYSKPVQTILNAVLSSRPASAMPLGEFISRYASTMGNLGSTEALAKRQASSTAERIMRTDTVEDAIREAQGAGGVPDARAKGRQLDLFY